MLQSKKMLRPSFHTIVQPSSVQAGGQLKIPPNFLKYLNENFSGDAILVGPSGEQWKVTIFKKENDVYMQNGWPQFLSDHLVLSYEFLLFTYDGENCFHVQIFSKSGLERLYPKKIRQEEAATPRLKKIKKRRPGRTSDDLPPSNKVTLPKGYCPKPVRKSSIKTEKTKACKLAETFTTGNPYLKHLMTKSNVENQCILPIAADFGKKNLPEDVKEIILENSEGRSWTVTCCHSNDKRYFTRGWGKFVQDNKLKRGDTCIFELKSKILMKVHTFRCSAN